MFCWGGFGGGTIFSTPNTTTMAIFATSESNRAIIVPSGRHKASSQEVSEILESNLVERKRNYKFPQILILSTYSGKLSPVPPSLPWKNRLRTLYPLLAFWLNDWVHLDKILWWLRQSLCKTNTKPWGLYLQVWVFLKKKKTLMYCFRYPLPKVECLLPWTWLLANFTQILGPF